MAPFLPELQLPPSPEAEEVLSTTEVEDDQHLASVMVVVTVVPTRVHRAKLAMT